MLETAIDPKLMLRRVKDKLSCLYADGNEELTEFMPIDFTNKTVQRVMIFADPGGTSAALDARIINIKVRAEEVTTKRVAGRDMGMSILWWLLFPAVLLAVAAALCVYRKRQQTND